MQMILNQLDKQMLLCLQKIKLSWSPKLTPLKDGRRSTLNSYLKSGAMAGNAFSASDAVAKTRKRDGT